MYYSYRYCDKKSCGENNNLSRPSIKLVSFFYFLLKISFALSNVSVDI